MATSDKGPVRGPFFFVRRLGALLALTGAASLASAEQLYDLVFDTGKDDRVRIGTLAVEAFDEEGGFRVTLDEDAFGDYFLSMRPFRCITHRDKMLCHLPYPYENRRRLSREDLTDLEYDLLFIARSPTEYGIDPWNGRYFDLRWEGDRLVGDLFEMDLDILAAPPEDGSLRPLADAERVPLGASESQWAPVLRIVPRPPQS